VGIRLNIYRDRELHIEDDEGNCVVLKNEQIGELWAIIKPSGR